MMPDEALKNILTYLYRVGALQFQVKLAQNNPSMADEDVTLADLTEASFGGYGYLTIPSLPAPSEISDGEWDVVTDTLTWTADGTSGLPQTIYGLYITFVDAGSTHRLWGWSRFATPVVLSFAGNTVDKKLELATEDLPL